MISTLTINNINGFDMLQKEEDNIKTGEFSFNWSWMKRLVNIMKKPIEQFFKIYNYTMDQRRAEYNSGTKDTDIYMVIAIN